MNEEVCVGSLTIENEKLFTGVEISVGQTLDAVQFQIVIGGYLD